MSVQRVWTVSTRGRPAQTRRAQCAHLALGHRLDVGGGEYDPEPCAGPGLVANVPDSGGWGSAWLGFEAFDGGVFDPEDGVADWSAGRGR